MTVSVTDCDNLSAYFGKSTTNLLLKIVKGVGTPQIRKWDLLGERHFWRGQRMIRSECVGWIVVVGVGWHGTTMDDATADLNQTHSSFFLYNLANSRWTISDCTAKVESWATNAPNAIPVLTHR